jgi:hypothetical protein
MDRQQSLTDTQIKTNTVVHSPQHCIAQWRRANFGKELKNNGENRKSEPYDNQCATAAASGFVSSTLQHHNSRTEQEINLKSLQDER